MRLAFPFLITFVVTLTACAEFPALDGTISPSTANAPFPELIPLAPVLAQANASDRSAANVQAALTPRIANLRARALRLRGPVIPSSTRTRMLRGVR